MHSNWTQKREYKRETSVCKECALGHYYRCTNIEIQYIGWDRNLEIYYYNWWLLSGLLDFFLEVNKHTLTKQYIL